MLRVTRARLALALACFASIFGCSWAVAADEPCTAPKIDVVTPPGEEWQTATAELTEHLRGIADLDKCAHVTVRPASHGAILDITTSDGRKASRQVENVPELLRAAEALLVLPPEPARAVTKPSPAESPPAEPRAQLGLHESATHVELGAGGALRFGGGPLDVGGGIAGFADFALDHWLLAVSARWDIIEVIVSQPTLSDFYMQSSAVGVSAGRRLELSNVNVDTLIGPSIVLESQDADDGEREVHGAAADFRLSLALRVSGPRFSSVRAFATGDFEASPARIRSAKSVDHALPPLPWWSSGLAVGVLWGAR